jgi:hypothetical protein
MKKAVLFFDTSTIGAGCILLENGVWPTLHALRRLKFGTVAGDAVLDELFAEAKRLREDGYQCEVSCERIYTGGGRSPGDRKIRDAINQRLGMLQAMARRNGLKWEGEIAPATAKKALTSHGNSGKERMIQCANLRYGQKIVAVYGALLTHTGDSRTCHEHEADAIGGGIAALRGGEAFIGAKKSHEKASNTEFKRRASLAKKAPTQGELF